MTRIIGLCGTFCAVVLSNFGEYPLWSVYRLAVVPRRLNSTPPCLLLEGDFAQIG
jgi:hypothetical protein